MIFRRELNETKGQPAKRIKISPTIQRRCEIFTVDLVLRYGIGKQIKMIKNRLEQRPIDENLEIVTIGSLKIYEDQELKADTILVNVAKHLFSEGRHEIKVTIEKIITNHDDTLMMLLTGKRMIQL